MIRSVSRPNKLSYDPSANRGTDIQLIQQNKRLRSEIIDLKNLNLQYTTFLSKALETQYSESSSLTSREIKLANINNYQKQVILRLKKEIEGYKVNEAQYARINNFMKSKPFRSVEDMFEAYQALTGEMGDNKKFIQKLEETIESLRKELQEQGEMATLKNKVKNLEEKNMRNEMKCERLMREIEEGVKNNNSLKIQTFNTEIKLRELQLKEQRTDRILSQKLYGSENKSTVQKGKSKKK